jgi:hypothetical protein
VIEGEAAKVVRAGPPFDFWSIRSVATFATFIPCFGRPALLSFGWQVAQALSGRAHGA